MLDMTLVLLFLFVLEHKFFWQEIKSYRPVIILGLFGLVIVVIFIKVRAFIRKKQVLKSVTKLNRGERSERNLIYRLITYGVPAQTIFHDLYFKKRNGEYAQVDLLVATSVGILVFEVKDYKGWIYGNENQHQWTQVLSYGKSKSRFYNPVMQNDSHIRAIRGQHPQFKRIPFFSIIVFYGDCVLKEEGTVPDGTFLVKPDEVMDVINTITSSNEPAPYTDKWEVIRVFKEAATNGESKLVYQEHLRNVQSILERR